MNFNKAAGFNLALKPISVKERNTAKFTCAVIGKPDPEVSWYKGTELGISQYCGVESLLYFVLCYCNFYCITFFNF